MGAGIFGLTIAWECRKRGAMVQIIDPNGVGAGSSGGIVGALAPHTPENWNIKKQVQFENLISAERFWAEVDEISGLESGYGRIGRLQPIQDEKGLALAHARAEKAKTLWQGLADWSVIRASANDAWSVQSPTGWLVHDTLSARMHPRRAGNSLARALHQRDVNIVPDAASKGAVIWATGYQGLLDLSEKLGTSAGNGVKGQAALLDCNAQGVPQLFADGIHIIPHIDGTVAVGSTSEREFVDPISTDAQLDPIIEKARAVCPALRDARVIERWAGVRPRARSRAPILGQHPNRPGHYIANGGFKIGFGMAPAIAVMMADLVLEQADKIPDAFRVEANL